MSFSAYARRVRDPAQPYQRRVSALRSCVQLYRPLGFHVTLSFLREVAGPFEHDEPALLHALDALGRSRAGWHADLRRYAAHRSALKLRGRRRPHPGEPNPNQGPRCWYGAPRQGALHALAFWRDHRLPALVASGDPAAVQINAHVAACLAAAGPLTPVDRHGLGTVRNMLKQRIQPGYNDDYDLFQRTRQLLTVARFIETAADARTGTVHDAAGA